MGRKIFYDSVRGARAFRRDGGTLYSFFENRNSGQRLDGSSGDSATCDHPSLEEFRIEDEDEDEGEKEEEDEEANRG